MGGAFVQWRVWTAYKKGLFPLLVSGRVGPEKLVRRGLSLQLNSSLY